MTCEKCKFSHFWNNDYKGTCWECNKIVKRDDLKCDKFILREK